MCAARRTYGTRKRDDSQTSFVNGSETSGPSRSVELTDEMLREERQKLIEERQNEMARVFDRHDDLVRTIHSYVYNG